VRHEGPEKNKVVVGGVQRRIADRILKGSRGLGKVGRKKRRRFAVIVQRDWGIHFRNVNFRPMLRSVLMLLLGLLVSWVYEQWKDLEIVPIILIILVGPGYRQVTGGHGPLRRGRVNKSTRCL
jgi:hypothetical protein